MNSFSNLSNLDLFFLGIAVAGIGILGFIVLFSNRKSITNRSFLYFSLITIIWGLVNYFAYHTSSPEVSFWLFRFVIFIATWHSFYIFRLFYMFPLEKFSFSKFFKYCLIPVTAIISIINLTPLSFSRIGEVSADGKIIKIINGPGIIFFGIFIMLLVTSALVLLIKKTVNAKSHLEKVQFIYVLIGTGFTFSALMVFNFILPAFYDNPDFIPLSGIFVFPFIAFTSYAILRHHLLNIKVIATEILTFILAIVTLFEVLASGNLQALILRIGVFALTLTFGILLIKSVRREVEQREELQKLNKELEEAKAKLEDLNRFKTQLLSIASHQIKSPLAAIKGFVSLILDGSYGETTDKTKETLARVKKSADELINLINTLLDLRKVEEGKMDYHFKKTDIVKLAKDVVEGLRPLAMEKKLDFSFSSLQNEIFVNADEEKLRQVFQNLTDNAIKYTPTGFVKVEIQDMGSEATISVSDSGLGISPILLPHIFEEFTRDERVKQAIRGTGLGLYIVQKITEAHGGQIVAESAGENMGSRFTVKLKKL